MSALSAPPKTGIWFCGHFIDPSKRPTGDLARWGARCFHPDNHNELVEIPLILKPVQLQFLERAMVKYGFTDLNEVYRHLVFVSNVVEVPAKKKIIFKKVRTSSPLSAQCSRRVADTSYKITKSQTNQPRLRPPADSLPALCCGKSERNARANNGKGRCACVRISARLAGGDS